MIALWNHRFAGIAEEMGARLVASAMSTNIKERRDCSCAIFDPHGRLLAQAAHIPVHLGSATASVEAVLDALTLAEGDIAIVNDPYAGGTHLPDVTLVTAVFIPEIKQAIAYLAVRAHHADIGGASPGSMPVGAFAAPGEIPRAVAPPPAVGPQYEQYVDDGPTGIAYRALTIADEGFRIAPALLDDALVERFVAASRTPTERRGDLAAQRAALVAGRARVVELVSRHGIDDVLAAMDALLAHGERLMTHALERIPNGVYAFADSLDDDGAGSHEIPIRVVLEVDGGRARVDFSDSADETDGSLNAVRAVTVSAVRYAFRLLLAADAPTNDGIYAALEIITAPGTIVDARAPRAVSAGNVETSQRIVDVVLGALAQALPDEMPAASSGTMNNLLIGSDASAYYETLAGGSGGAPGHAGVSGIHTHMTNTQNTPVEALERELPVRVTRYAIRRGSGGGGGFSGGDGVVRELEFLAPQTVTLIGERRRRPAYGLGGGGPGRTGEDHLTRDGVRHHLPAKIVLPVQAGDVLTIETPGGGGFGDENKRRFWAKLLSGEPFKIG